MTQLEEAVHRYHRLLESEPLRNLEWAERLQSRLREQHVLGGTQAIAPVLRPHLISRKQHGALVKAAELVFNAIDRMERLALSTPQLLSRMQLLPAEKMLAAVDPGYSHPAVTALLDTTLHHASLHFLQCNSENTLSLVYADLLADAFDECEPMLEMRKRYAVSRLGGIGRLLEALSQAYREFGGTRQPRIAILGLRPSFVAGTVSESANVAEVFCRGGYQSRFVTPESLDYRNGVLRSGDFEIDLVYRQVKVHEFLIRFDLNHALMRAYRDRKVCMVNSFRSELAQKRAIFDLLSDDAVTHDFPPAERKALKEFLPWTRVVAGGMAMHQGQRVDLLDFIRANRTTLVLKPNDDANDEQTFTGAEMEEAGWDRAIRTAQRSPYVVQEVMTPGEASFPVYRWGTLEMRDMQVHVLPQSYLGQVQGCSGWVRPLGSTGFSTLEGLVPTFVVDTKA